MTKLWTTKKEGKNEFHPKVVYLNIWFHLLFAIENKDSGKQYNDNFASIRTSRSEIECECKQATTEN